MRVAPSILWLRSAAFVAVFATTLIPSRADEPPAVPPVPQYTTDLGSFPDEIQRATTPARTIAVANEEAIRRALDTPIDLDVHERPLSEVVALLAKQTGATVQIDKRKIEEAGRSVDAPVTAALKGVTLRSALRLILRDFELMFIIKDEVLLITTVEEAEANLIRKMYDVTDLVTWHDDEGRPIDDFDSLIEIITSVVHPVSWQVVGGPCPDPQHFATDDIKVLVIRHTLEGHEGVASLLAELRLFHRQANRLDKEPPAQPTNSQIADLPAGQTILVTPLSRPWEKTIQRALDKFIDLNAANTPLMDVVATLEKQTEIRIMLDRMKIEEAGKSVDAPVTKSLSGVTLRSALRLILRDYELTYMLKDEVLLITTQEEAEANLIRRFYNVADLVVRQDAEGRPIEDFEPLIKTIVSSVRPTSWDEVGGPCPAPSPFTTDKMKVLVIAQLTEGHEEVEAVLANLRALRQESPKAVEGLPK